jgi:hypothetical protein
MVVYVASLRCVREPSGAGHVKFAAAYFPRRLSGFGCAASARKVQATIAANTKPAATRASRAHTSSVTHFLDAVSSLIAPRLPSVLQFENAGLPNQLIISGWNPSTE